METYLYGDSTLSPFQHDFIAFLPEAIDFIVQALLCDSRIDDALQRAAQLTDRTAKEIEDAQTMLVEAAGPIERRTSVESDSLAARCGAQIRRNISELVHAEIERAQAAVAAETARAEQTAAAEHAAFAKAFDSLVLRRVLVDATEGVEVSADTGRYAARRRASTSYGLRWIAKIDIPTSHPLGRILRLERLIDRIDAIAREHAPDAVGAVGLIENKPNSRNVVPGEVFFSIDFRHPEDRVLDIMESKLRQSLAELLPPLRLTYKEERIWNSPAVKFAPELIECVRIGTQKADYASRDMISGAGHDAAYVARVAPTTMIFVPCAGGISHNEAESTSFEECAAGAQVLLNAVLEYDRRLG